MPVKLKRRMETFGKMSINEVRQEGGLHVASFYNILLICMTQLCQTIHANIVVQPPQNGYKIARDAKSGENL